MVVEAGIAIVVVILWICIESSAAHCSYYMADLFSYGNVCVSLHGWVQETVIASLGEALHGTVLSAVVDGYGSSTVLIVEHTVTLRHGRQTSGTSVRPCCCKGTVMKAQSTGDPVISLIVNQVVLH